MVYVILHLVVRGDVEVPIYRQPKQSRAKVFLVF